MQKANAGKRFLAWLIDLIIIGAIGALIGLAIPTNDNSKLQEPIAQGDTITYSQLYPYYVEHQDDTLGWDYYLIYGHEGDSVFENYNYEGLKEQYNLYTSTDEYAEYKAQSLFGDFKSKSITGIISLILFILYYDVLGYFWSKQTVGRLAVKIKVVDYEGRKPSFGTLFLRDVVGFEIINSVCCGIPAIINIFLICGHDKSSIGDRMSRTMMIDTSVTQTDDELHFGSNNDSTNDSAYYEQQPKAPKEPEEAEVVDTIYDEPKENDSSENDLEDEPKKDSKEDNDDEIW